MRGKIRPDEAEAEGCGGPTVEADKEVRPDFRRNPKGRGHFSSSLRRSSLRYARYLSLLASRTEKKWLPSPAAPSRYTLGRLHRSFGDGGIQQALVIGHGKTQHMTVDEVLQNPGPRGAPHSPPAFGVMQEL